LVSRWAGLLGLAGLAISHSHSSDGVFHLLVLMEYVAGLSLATEECRPPEENTNRNAIRSAGHRWQYRHLPLPQPVSGHMDAMGEEGWELVSAWPAAKKDGLVCVFKRPLQSD